MPEQMKFRYFSPMPGCAVARYGTPVHIGATRTPTGFVINPDEIAAVPEREVNMYAKEYMDAVRNKELRERTEEEFNLQQAQIAEREVQEQREREAAQAPTQPAPVPEGEAPFEGGSTAAESPISKPKKK